MKDMLKSAIMTVLLAVSIVNCGSETSDNSNVVSTIPTGTEGQKLSDTSAPTAPSGLVATAMSATQINLNWNASTDDVGVAGYEVWRGTTNISTATTTSYSDIGLTAGTSYTYTVHALDAAGNVSDASNSANATTSAAASVPTLSSVAILPANPTIESYSTVQFTATGTMTDNTTLDLTTIVTWASSNTVVATIDNSGLATAMAEGTTAISATSSAATGSISSSITLTVPVIVRGMPIKLAKTGQVACYDSYGFGIECTTAIGAGQDGAWQKGVDWPNPRFTVNADTSVTDNLTGLIWAPNGNLMPTQDDGWDSDAVPNDGLVTWEHSLAYPNKLNSEKYLGHIDWRLPNLNEMNSLVNYVESNNVAWLNTQGFTNVQDYSYWTTTTYSPDAADAWSVHIGGAMGGVIKSAWAYVWPLRAALSRNDAPATVPKTGQNQCYSTTGAVISCLSDQDGALQYGADWPHPRFTLNADTSITDNLSSLIWAPDGNMMPTRDPSWDTDYERWDTVVDDGRVTWEHALTYVAKLNTENYLGHNDWRLPNINELRSLINAGQDDNAAWLNSQGFINAQTFYWSSTSSAFSSYNAWYVAFWFGYTDTRDKTSLSYVWPVRAGD
jgi:hypothetical protein